MTPSTNFVVSCGSFFFIITGEQSKKKITYIPVEEEGIPTEDIEMGESLAYIEHRVCCASL